MCGRYSITQDLTELEKIVKFICKITDFKRRYNIAPRSHVPVLVWENGQNVLKEMRWGLIPGWSKDEKIGDKLTNARSETITEKQSYKRPFEKQRCLIPADGFYEWQWLDPKGKNKQKYLITRPDDEAFALAGLWNQWTDKTTGEILNTYTILTKEANELMAEIHNSQKRMPIVLSQNNEMDWLTGKEVSTEDIELIATMV